MALLPVLSSIVTRAAVGAGLTDLQLHDPTNGLEIIGFAAGGVEKVRQNAASTYVDYDVQIGSRKAKRSGLITMAIRGSTATEMWTRVDLVCAAFDQLDRYTITTTFDGAGQKIWLCDDADWNDADAALNGQMLPAFEQHYVFTVPYQPST